MGSKLSRKEFLMSGAAFLNKHMKNNQISKENLKKAAILEIKETDVKHSRGKFTSKTKRADLDGLPIIKEKAFADDLAEFSRAQRAKVVSEKEMRKKIRSVDPRLKAKANSIGKTPVPSKSGKNRIKRKLKERKGGDDSGS